MRCYVIEEVYRLILVCRVLFEILGKFVFLKYVGSFIRFYMKIKFLVFYEMIDLVILEYFSIGDC